MGQKQEQIAAIYLSRSMTTKKKTNKHKNIYIMLTKHIFPKQLSLVSWFNLMNCINLVLISATNLFSKLHTSSCINKSLL